MAKEIESKFLIDLEKFPANAGRGDFIRQGYVSMGTNTVRVRTLGSKGYLTVKSRGLVVRDEYEYEIPFNDACEMLENCLDLVIEKWRFTIRVGDYIWEIDHFKKEHEGLVVAEVEFQDMDHRAEFYEDIERGLFDWIVSDVTEVPYYTNVELARGNMSWLTE